MFAGHFQSAGVSQAIPALHLGVIHGGIGGSDEFGRAGGRGGHGGDPETGGFVDADTKSLIR